MKQDYKIFTFFQNNFLRKIRYKKEAELIERCQVETILDIGCMDMMLPKLIDFDIEYEGIDIKPKGDVKKMSIEKLSNKKYDMVICTEVLEHLENPIKAIQKIKSIARKYILISVPNEPYYTLLRCCTHPPEHLWTIFPDTLKLHLGKPIEEKLICFNRHYLGLWRVK